MIELELGVHFDLHEGLEVKDYSLQIDNQYFRRLLDEYLLCYLFNSLVAVRTKIVRDLLNLDQLVETFLQGFHALHLHRKIVIILQDFVLVLAGLADNLSHCLTSE